MGERPEFFQDFITTIKETSRDSEHNEFMTTSKIKVINFDKLKGWYVKRLNAKESLTILSNDALFLGRDRIVFIEFKNGSIDPKENNRIIFKLYDSILLLFDRIIPMEWYQSTFEKNLSFARKHIEYVLVYNAKRQTRETPQTCIGIKRQRRLLQESDNRDRIGKYVRHRAGEMLIKFGLDRFKNYIFKEVYTFTQEEFNAKFISTLCEEYPFNQCLSMDPTLRNWGKTKSFYAWCTKRRRNVF